MLPVDLKMYPIIWLQPHLEWIYHKHPLRLKLHQPIPYQLTLKSDREYTFDPQLSQTLQAISPNVNHPNVIVSFAYLHYFTLYLIQTYKVPSFFPVRALLPFYA